MTFSLSQIQARAAASAHAGHHWGVGHCLQFVRSMFGARGGVYDAKTAYNIARANRSLRATGVPPAGAAVFFRVGRHWHIAVSDGNGFVWSTDVRRAGRVDRISISALCRAWGAVYVGYTTLLNGVQARGVTVDRVKTRLVGTTYVMRTGDTLSEVAARFGTTVARLMALNSNIHSPDRIAVGYKLRTK